MLDARTKPKFPKAGENGANGFRETKVAVLNELIEGPLTVYSLIVNCELREAQVRNALRANTGEGGKKTPLVQFEGWIYDAVVDRDVQRWGLTDAGQQWVSEHPIDYLGDEDDS